MGRNQATFAKRQRELQRQRKRQEKADRRRDRQTTDLGDNNGADSEEDPDLIGLVAGPQTQPLEDDVDVVLDEAGGVRVVPRKKASSTDA